MASAPPASKGSAPTAVPPHADAPAGSGKKPKLVRDSFTIPKAEYAAIDHLKGRALAAGRSVKKSELLRAGLLLLTRLDDEALGQALAAVPPLKTGRPKRPEVATPPARAAASAKASPKAKSKKTAKPAKPAKAKNGAPQASAQASPAVQAPPADSAGKRKRAPKAKTAVAAPAGSPATAPAAGPAPATVADKAAGRKSAAKSS
ncbi:MAG: hypothetical protein ACK40S_10700 [Burkholderiaceae bacterium]